MPLTVKQLIAALRRMPPHSTIIVADHDQNSESGEYNGTVQSCMEASELLKERTGAEVVINL
ncbi:hypothetical protein [Croceicoccus gelatinilyticus]|uniref:hypothetical protein n=1 Tax=Croceicoccus gelatinilyticus TaxID=2835536 RepID=UPI001BCE239B|nr:hypothetical protein [Croceicoccus gelatinilyticus]MBS7671739.1 hypothetical protein [Croceicoccus gelatinilyticus]